MQQAYELPQNIYKVVSFYNVINGKGLILVS